ncbi:zinc finger protein 771-like [Culicoides brevitarsis]|uniref:zinc finger protein 771-like n=1 Tax=Culicoides brevitarsis TaxID=469753 RepID=UPI00307B82D6
MSQEINLLLELDECQEWIFSVISNHDIKQMGNDSFKKIKAKFSENVEESCEKCSERLQINLFFFDESQNRDFSEACDDIDIEEPQAWEPECILQRQDSYEVNQIKEEPPIDMEEVDFIGFDEHEDDEMNETSQKLDDETIRNMLIPKSDDPKDPKPFKCPKCSMGFVAQKNVRRHLKNNSCRFPRPSATGQQHLTPLITSMNRTLDDDFDMFGDTMNEDSLRTLTIPKSAEEDDKKPYKCPKCKLGFVAQKNVRRHLKNNSCKSDDIQQGLRPYMCPNCKMRFTTRNNTKKHIARNACGALDSSNGTEPLMVDESDPKPFKCPECQIGFSCRKNVLRHLNANACQMLKGNGNKRAIDNCKAYLPKDLILPDLSQIKAPYSEAFEQPDGTFAYVSLTSKQAELRVTNFDPNHLTCELCHEILKNTSDLISHRKHLHFFPKNQLECAGCGKSFESSNEKRWHSFYCVEKFNIIAEQEMT